MNVKGVRRSEVIAEDRPVMAVPEGEPLIHH